MVSAKRTGLHWFLILLAVIWMGDTVALVAGKLSENIFLRRS